MHRIAEGNCGLITLVRRFTGSSLSYSHFPKMYPLWIGPNVLAHSVEQGNYTNSVEARAQSELDPH